ncbi:MAG: type IV secretory system conjugative DNA transfer family protein, partial [Bdellovibrionales bacterium]|nr:type IV secretory system conjugative DNA transfer family protein [Bdellovibrionales bacterium]
TMLLVLGGLVHFALGGADAEAPLPRELPAIEQVDSPGPSGRLEGLEERLSGARTRTPVPTTVPNSDPSQTLSEPVDWHEVGLTLLWWALGIGAVLYVLRMHPDLLRLHSLSKLLPTGKDWIRPMRSKTNELGSSDLATTKQIKRWLTKNDRYDTALPVTDLRGSAGVGVKSGMLVIPREERNRHILIIAKTGSGKTTKLILPILYNDCMCPHRSTIIIDSKQEMWSKLAAMTRKHNPHKNLVLFNPLDTLRSLSWNILSKVHSDTDCKLIANSIIMATDEPQARQDSPFFRNSALQILNAMMVGLLNDPDEDLSVPRIHQLINRGMQGLCDWLEAHPESIRTTRAFVELARSGSQNADTIMSELSMRLQAWDLKAIRATTFRNEFDVEKVVSEPTLFVVELRESELKMLRPLANVIVVELLRYLTKYAEECPGQSLPRPVGLVIDEFASALGRLPDIHIKLNTLRSRNVSIVAAIQSIGQIKGNYGEDWESVLSGFSTKIFMPSLDYTDAEWASKESGIMTVRYRTASKGTNRKITDNFSHRNQSQNEQIQQRQVLTPGEVGRPSDNQATFFMPETPVFQGHLTPYYKVADMIRRFDEFKSAKEISLRQSEIEYEEEAPPPPTSAAGDAAHQREGELSEQEVWSALEEMKAKHLDWDNTTGDARKWWLAFEEENKNRIALVLKVGEEIQKRGATITDFFLAYVYSNTDNIQATLAYLDYTMHMKTAEA